MLRSPLINVALFLATVATVLWAAPFQDGSTGIAARVPFAAALLGILGTHEMGHFLLARRHRVDVTWPYFIPVPMGVGTFGAFIKIRSALPSRRAVLEVGAAGPLAGFAVALPLLLWGFAHSEVVAVPADAGNPNLQSPLTLLLAWLHGVPIAPQDATVTIFGDSLITWFAARATHGALAAGTDLAVHPVAIAAWLGMFVTAINLIPVGQLDGGHVTYSLFGPRAETLSRLVMWALLAMGLLLSWNWLIWWAIARFAIRPHHPRALDEQPLSRGHRALAFGSLALLVVTLAPVPFHM